MVRNLLVLFLAIVASEAARSPPAVRGKRSRTLDHVFEVNFQPLIGIVSQPGDGVDGELIDSGGSNATVKAVGNYSYIAASYVKWVEMAGARVIPIIYNEPQEIIMKKFESINGLLFPGGGTDLVPSEYFSTVRQLYDLAKSANDAGEYFPLQATCLGMESLVILVADDFDALQRNEFNASYVPSTISFLSEWAKTQFLFSWLDDDLTHALQSKPLTMENHHDGSTLEFFKGNKKLMDFFHVLTTSKDLEGKVYVSTIEGKHYPFYGTQWHPEKIEFEWGIEEIPHSLAAVKVAQAAADFFVNEARKNQRRPSNEDIQDWLIYNYAPVFSGLESIDFEQLYLFEPNATSFSARKSSERSKQQRVAISVARHLQK